MAVELVDRALAEECEWKQNAKEFAKQITTREDSDGVTVNVQAVSQLSEGLQPLTIKSKSMLQFSI